MGIDGADKWIYISDNSNVRDIVEMVTPIIRGEVLCYLFHSTDTCQFAKTFAPLKQKLYVQSIHAETSKRH